MSGKPGYAPRLSDVQAANVTYHSLLAEHYHQQPFFSNENRARVRGVLESLRARTGGNRLLDVGCGTGFILDQAHDLFDQLDGIDITPGMLERIKPRENVRTRIATAESLPFDSGVFDAVTSYGLLHHLETPALFFAEARRVLKPGGILYSDEFPSPDFREMVNGVGYGELSTDLSRNEWSKVVDDAERYQNLGIGVDQTQAAMVQCYQKRLLGETALRDALRDAGFTSVQIVYRWFAGEGVVRRDMGQAAAEIIESYLRQLLPFSRRFFKYTMLFAC